MGRLGQKTGAGVYDYEPGDRTETVLYYGKVACEAAEKFNIKQREISEEEIIERCFFSFLTWAAISCTRASPIEPQTSILFTSMGMVSPHGAEAPCIGPNTLSGLRRS